MRSLMLRKSGNPTVHDSELGYEVAAAAFLSVLLHLGVNAPLAIYPRNLTMFSFPLVSFLKYSLVLGGVLAAAVGTLLVALQKYRIFILGRVIVWALVFLIVSFQSALFIPKSVLDGRALDAGFIRCSTEGLLFLAGLAVMLCLPSGHYKKAALGLAIYVVVNAGLSVGQAWPLIAEQIRNPTSQQANLVARNNDIAHALAPMLPFFGTASSDLARIDSYSRDRNIIIVLVDTLQSDLAEEVIEQTETIKSRLDGFVFYRNAAGMFPYTGFSVPMILSGEIYRAGDSISEYFSRADKQRLEHRLQEEGFSTSFLGIWSRQAYAVGPTEARHRELMQLASVISYRQLPTGLRSLYFDRNYDFLGNQAPNGLEQMGSASTDIQIINRLTAQAQSQAAAAPQFKYIHLWGLHPPYALDRGCRPTGPGVTREQFIEQGVCVLSSLTEYLSALKAKGVYDLSQIFIIADHGTVLFPVTGSQPNDFISAPVQSSAHPTILFKDFGKTGSLTYSDSPVSLLDVRATILGSVLSSPETRGDLRAPHWVEPRERKFFFYPAADDALGERIERLETYSIGPNVRRLEGWKRD